MHLKSATCHNVTYSTVTDKSDVDKTGVLVESLKLKKFKKACVVSAAMKIEEGIYTDRLNTCLPALYTCISQQVALTTRRGPISS